MKYGTITAKVYRQRISGATGKYADHESSSGGYKT